MAKQKLVKVKPRQRKLVAHMELNESHPIHEAGETYHPERKVPGKDGKTVVIPADTFTVTEKRAKALGDNIEIIGDAGETGDDDTQK